MSAPGHVTHGIHVTHAILTILVSQVIHVTLTIPAILAIHILLEWPFSRRVMPGVVVAQAGRCAGRVAVRYPEQTPPCARDVVHKVYPAYHEEDPPHDAHSVCDVTVTARMSALLDHLKATLDLDPGYDLPPMEEGRVSHETRLQKSLSVEAVNLHTAAMASSEPTSPLKGAQSIDCMDLASSRLPVASPRLRAAQSMDGVHRTGLRRNNYSFEDKLLAHLTNQSGDMMEFDEPDTWSQASYESSVASMTDGSLRRATGQSSNVLSRMHSVGDKMDLQNASRRGLSHSMILTWLSNKRYVPANEPISEGAGDGAGTGSAPKPLASAEPDSTLTGIGLTGTGISIGPVDATGLTAAATAMVAANVDAGSGSSGMDPKKMKINYRELNACSPSYW